MSEWRLSVNPTNYDDTYEYHFDEEPVFDHYAGEPVVRFVGLCGGRRLHVCVVLENTDTYYLEELGKEAAEGEGG